MVQGVFSVNLAKCQDTQTDWSGRDLLSFGSFLRNPSSQKDVCHGQHIKNIKIGFLFPLKESLIPNWSRFFFPTHQHSHGENVRWVWLDSQPRMTVFSMLSMIKKCLWSQDSMVFKLSHMIYYMGTLYIYNIYIYYIHGILYHMNGYNIIIYHIFMFIYYNLISIQIHSPYFMVKHRWDGEQLKLGWHFLT